MLRSGVGWNDLPNFIITSGFVRLLGASEQYEMDAIKSLLYYRPMGRSAAPEEFAPEEATSDVLTEMPDEQGNFSKPSLLL